MNTATDIDETLESSTSTHDEPSSQPAEDSALDGSESTDATPSVGEEDGQPASETATTGEGQPGASESDKTTTELAIDHLSGSNKRARQKDAKDQQTKEGDPKPETETKAKVPAKPAKTDHKAPSDLTAEERAAMPERTRQRFDKLLGERKTVTEELSKVRTEYEPIRAKATELGITDLAQVPKLIEAGRGFGAVVEQFKLRDDIAAIADEDAAGAIRFQACLARFANGKGTQADLDTCRTVFDRLDQDREALGLKPAAPAVPAIDTEAWEKAIDKADKELEFTDLRKLVDGLKASAKAPTPADRPAQPTQPAQQVQRQPAPAAPVEDPSEQLYEQRVIRRLTADGVKPAEAAAYFEKHLYPLILKDLGALNPGKNPVVVFKSIGPRERHDLAVEAHAAVQTQKAKLAPPADKPAPGQRPLAAGGGKAAWAQPRASASHSSAAIDHLAGD